MQFEIQKVRVVKILKIFQWVLKQPIFHSNESAVYLSIQGNQISLGIIAQDLLISANVDTLAEEVEQPIQRGLPVNSFQRVIAGMDGTIQCQVEEQQVILQDSLQRVSLNVLAVPTLPSYTQAEGESAHWNNLLHIQHLLDVATELSDSTDLDVSFTQQHGYIGNYVYVKRVAHQSPYELTYSYIVAKLLLMMGALEGQVEYDMQWFTYPYSICEIRFPNTVLHTNLLSRQAALTSQIFTQGAPTHTLQLGLGELKPLLIRAHQLTEGNTIQLNFQEDNTCLCRVQDEYLTSELSLQYQGTPIQLTFELEKDAMYRLFKKTLGDGLAEVQIHIETEHIYIRNQAEEIIISALF